jgi:lactobin A/cerein 7B family class IIb bacteriocin
MTTLVMNNGDAEFRLLTEDELSMVSGGAVLVAFLVVLFIAAVGAAIVFHATGAFDNETGWYQIDTLDDGNGHCVNPASVGISGWDDNGIYGSAGG